MTDIVTKTKEIKSFLQHLKKKMILGKHERFEPSDLAISLSLDGKRFQNVPYLSYTCKKKTDMAYSYAIIPTLVAFMSRTQNYDLILEMKTYFSTQSKR